MDTVTAQDFTIAPEQLQIGVYVCLDLGWMEHPFSFNNFKIKTQDQIDTLRALGLRRVRWDPAKSDVQPLPLHRPPVVFPQLANSVDSPEESLPGEPVMLAKYERIERLRRYREEMLQVERAFSDATTTVRNMNRGMFSRPKETVEQATRLVQSMVSAFFASPEIVIHVMSEKLGGEATYYHNLNASVLAMMLGREMDLSRDQVEIVGLGALFHDIGMTEVPAKIQAKTDPLTKAEREFREMHCEYGLDLGTQLGLAEPVLKIIYQHHECFDGSGYPRRHKGEEIDLLSRVVSIVNHYDNLCNPGALSQALTPHEALSQMFAQHRARFDPKILKVFIRSMGVYPPGTIVRLSNEVIGIVVAVNASKPLKPSVVVYDPQIPKAEALIIDLEREPDINISKAIRPDQLPRALFEYLNPRKRVSYYFDALSQDGRGN